ncbi:hypothetical protein EKH77_18955 [Streptomyces luteoverticillatus]|uniref:Uncharacterized protein n=1 Tax=Streptomyces luteoverticillatus TaxID=66425 RepID=A0A3Q9FY91_STRLT|nr:hypothetical protein [Streptomyces luteoverticillatus]AZQ73015.1 hypothetical protein EKH77_18955 [Streptomyces luteoverticillatus]
MSRTRRTALALAASTVLAVLGAVVTAPAAQAAPAAPMSTGGDFCRFVQTALANQGLTIGGTCPD